ncbi:hypothetical protein [Niabella hibiscisoli]|uniref:hypothetical protein n=1 Tax=Niabella hibiscisoli TaxID=1825928 RepID=UPI001F0F3051|nr:hypothetical protein [Niabella hibiscisoli]MCH5715474.1 hypothetical protein [Niabella hibiscisoli]
MDITLPRAVPIIARGTTITIDSSTVALGAMNFQLFNQASLYADGDKTVQLQKANDQSALKLDVYKTVFSDISINANNAFVRIGDHINIKNLKVDLNGQSTINFSEAVSIDTLSGHISEASVFNAPYRYSKFLK